MELAEQLKEELTSYQRQDADLIDWRFDLHFTRGIEVGLKEGRIGGPYSAPGYKMSVSGEAFLIWRNQCFTSAKLDAKAISDFKEYITLWKSTSYKDPDGVGLYQTSKIPDVPVYDEQVAVAIHRDSGRPFQLLSDGLQVLANAGMSSIDGKVRCFEDRRNIFTSQGFQIDYLQTPVDFFFEVNNSYAKGYMEKMWPTTAKMDMIISDIANVGRQLRHDINSKLSGAIRVIFPPDMLESFIDHYLTTNLYGSLVVNRQSRFTLADFQSNLQVLREDMNLAVNTLQPYRGFTYPCTAEGIPGGAIDFIRNGKLQTPILSHKYARKAGMSPTPSPSGGGMVLQTNRPSPNWKELIQNTERGLIIYSVLGLHTQDTSSGKFSVTADQCLYVENGEVQGKVKAVINGDFLNSLLEESSQLATVTGEDNPGYSFLATASN